MKERGEKFIAIERGRFSKIDSFVASEWRVVVVVVTREEGGEGGEGEGWVGDFSNASKQKAQPEIRDREKFSIGTIDGGARKGVFRRAPEVGLVYVGNF